MGPWTRPSRRKEVVLGDPRGAAAAIAKDVREGVRSFVCPFFDSLEEVDDLRERDLPPAGRGKQGGDVSLCDPAVECRLADPEQPRGLGSTQGWANDSLQVGECRLQILNELAFALTTCSAQPDDALNGPSDLRSVFRHDHRVTRKLNKESFFFILS
jgi:hypothetical protein